MLLLFNLVQIVASLSWPEAIAKAKVTTSYLNLTEKVKIVSGLGFGKLPCVGNIDSIPSIPGFHGLCLQDGPSGVRFSHNATTSTFPAAINLASTWDKKLMAEYGIAQGKEFRGKGINIALAPMMNIGRVAAGGRNWEGYGEDPFLSATAATLVMSGIQSVGVMATAKHYVGNEQEHFREFGYSKIDDRALYEIYLQPFKACVVAGVSAVMCGYNKLLTDNGELEYACEHSTIIDILKNELGFNGFLMSDWWSIKGDGVKAANNGLDMMMAGEILYNSTSEKPSDFMWSENLVKMVLESKVKESTVNDKVERILASWYKIGQDQNYPKLNLHSFDAKKDGMVNVKRDHANLIRRAAADSIILLKNDNVLPLSMSLSGISVIGENAFSAADPNIFPDRGGVSGHVALGWGSGSSNFPYLISPHQALMLRAQKNNLKVYSSKNIQLQPDSNLDSHVALVFVYSNSGEEYITVQGNRGDRNNLSLWDNGDDLVLKTANQYNNTVVIITSPGPVDMSRWINHKNIKGIVLALFPGQESGNAITDVLFGDVNPSAKLPFTIAKNSDYCCGVVYDSPGNVVYEESLLVGYRWFDAKNIVPMFPFGFGLSYTTFLVSRLNIVLQSDGSRWVTVIVRNTGRVAGSEVIQLYIGLPKSTASPVKQLKAFDKVFLKPKESKQVSFTLDSNHLSYWDIRTRSWTVAKGLYKIFVGTSSRDIRQSSYFME